jgi:hypothetical protein
MTAATDRLAEVRLKLAEAEAALAALPANATVKRKAAQDHLDVVSKALVQAKANVEAEEKASEHKAEAAPKLETRPAEVASEVREDVEKVVEDVEGHLSRFHKDNQSLSRQNLWGTEDLSLAEQAARRNH